MSDLKLNPWPSFTSSEIKLSSDVLASGKVNYWTGNHGKEFEKEFACFFDSKYSIAMANGSLALSACYLACGIGNGDEVITAPRTFLATSSALVTLKAVPVFADVDQDSGCITAESIEPLITTKTRAISVVHLGGWPADMPKIMDLAASRGLKVIEDCAQAHGAKIKTEAGWSSVGSFGDVAAWSFCQDKIMTTGGEGGMLSTSDDEIWEIAWSLKDHGKSWSLMNEQKRTIGFRWVHDKFGSNFRLTEFQSAIGRYQLSQLKDWLSLRAFNANVMINRLSECSVIRFPVPSDGFRHAWYKLHGYINPDALKSGWSRDRIVAEISKYGYPGLTGSCSEIYLERCFREAGLTPLKRLPAARLLGETSLMFLVHPTISSDQMELYSEVVYGVLKEAQR